MPINQTELISVVRDLTECHELKVTIKEAAKGAGIAASGAFLGGILGGPIGLAIGGIMGSVLGAYAGSTKFKSVASVIMEDMTPQQREELANSLRRALEDINMEDIVMFTGLVMGNANVQKLIITEVTKYLQNEMDLRIAA